MADKDLVPATEQLVNDALQGSKEALEEIVRRIQRPVYGLALRMLFLPSDAEDATQEILTKIVTHLKSFRFEGSFKAWAMQIAANHLSTMRRARAEKREVTMEKAYEVIDRAEAMGWFSEPLEAPEPLLTLEMHLACTQALLMALDRPHRLVFILGTIMECSSTEGAAILEISPAAFRQRLSRARKRIVDFLSANCGLLDEGNRCRCEGILTNHLKRGWIDPKQPMFAAGCADRDPLTTMKKAMKELDRLSRISAFFKFFPRPEGSTDFSKTIRKIIDSNTYLVLSDPRGGNETFEKDGEDETRH
ncbi:MAG: sigma-70 family RNA polymerase sigma factor [Desulfobacteraceae bacterium]|nr:MAG: sigma-70 family RNA polymerase sigma factor [Desulfobacteraceae bacterium]